MSFGRTNGRIAVVPTTDVAIRYFNNRFSWQWTKFTEDRAMVARILQVTREGLGYSASSRFPEVQFENMDGSGEWYLDTGLFQDRQGLGSEEANERLKDAFVQACQEIGEDSGVMFTFTVIDMPSGGKIIEEIPYDE